MVNFDISRFASTFRMQGSNLRRHFREIEFPLFEGFRNLSGNQKIAASVIVGGSAIALIVQLVRCLWGQRSSELASPGSKTQEDGVDQPQAPSSLESQGTVGPLPSAFHEDPEQVQGNDVDRAQAASSSGTQGTVNPLPDDGVSASHEDPEQVQENDVDRAQAASSSGTQGTVGPLPSASHEDPEPEQVQENVPNQPQAPSSSEAQETIPLTYPLLFGGMDIFEVPRPRTKLQAISLARVKNISEIVNWFYDFKNIDYIKQIMKIENYNKRELFILIDLLVKQEIVRKSCDRAQFWKERFHSALAAIFSECFNDENGEQNSFNYLFHWSEVQAYLKNILQPIEGAYALFEAQQSASTVISQDIEALNKWRKIWPTLLKKFQEKRVMTELQIECMSSCSLLKKKGIPNTSGVSSVSRRYEG